MQNIEENQSETILKLDVVILPDPPRKKKKYEVCEPTPEGEYYCKTGIDIT